MEFLGSRELFMAYQIKLADALLAGNKYDILENIIEL